MFNKTQKALTALREDILQKKYAGTELPSARKLCTIYNVGRGAMKVILSELQQEQLLFPLSERKLGINHKHSSAKKRKLLVISHPFLSYGWAGNISFERKSIVTDAALSRGVEVEFTTKDFINLNYMEFQQLQARHYSGVLFLELYHRETVLELLKNNIPVMISGVEENGDLPCCRLDYRQVGRLAAYELIRQGHQRIGVVTGSLQKFIFQEILRGIRGAMAEEFLTFDPELTAEISGQYGMVEDEVTLLKLLDTPRPPTGIIALRRNRIMLLQNICRQRNINIPQDISIVGFENPDWPGIAANDLTMVNDAILQLDKLTVNMLIDWISTGKAPESMIVAPTLHPGSSIRNPDENS